MSMFQNVPYISKKNLCFSCDQRWYLFWRYLLAFAFETLQLPFVRRCVAAMPLQTKKCHYCRNANRCKRLSNSDLETTPSRVSTSPSRAVRALSAHFKRPASGNSPQSASLPERRNLRLLLRVLQRLTLKKHLKQEQPPSQGRIPATSYNKIDIAINSHLAGSDPSTAHLMDVPILTNFQSHGVRMFDEKSHLWKKRS